MKLIVGLGNPGEKYDLTRHNVGWHALDALAGLLDTRIYINRSRGLTGQAFFGGEKLLLVKPLTYMNLSGECVRPLIDYYKLSPSDVIVLCDDVYLPLGQLRVRGGGSSGGHNGLKNLTLHLGSEAYPRIRIGVGPQPAGMDLMNFVMLQLTGPEQQLAGEAEDRAARAALSLLTDGLALTMNRFNQKVKTDGPEL